MIQITRATIAPGLMNLKPGCFTLGAAQERNANKNVLGLDPLDGALAEVGHEMAT
jgi:hypothetical protein